MVGFFLKLKKKKETQLSNKKIVNFYCSVFVKKVRIQTHNNTKILKTNGH